MKKIQSQWTKGILVGALLIIIYKLIDNYAVTVSALHSFLSVFAPCFIGFIIAFFFWKPASSLERLFDRSKMKFVKNHKKGFAVLVIYIIVVAIVSLLVKFVAPGLVTNIRELAINMPYYLKKADAYLNSNKYLSELGFVDTLYDRLGKFVSDNLSMDQINKYITLISGVANSFMSFFLGVVFSVYILLERDGIKSFAKSVYKRFPQGKIADTIKKYAYRVVDLFYSYFSGLAIDAIVVGTITAVVLSIFKVPYAVLLGALVAVGNMIPFFGPIISAVVIYVISAITFGPLKAIWVIIFQLGLGQLDGNLIQPRILSSSTGISPLLVLAAVIIFGDLFGFVGMIIGVPLMATIKMVVSDYLDNGSVDGNDI